MKTKKYHGLVNRKRVISTLEYKALVTGYRWTRPKTQKGFVENRSKQDKFLYYSLVEPVSILDVNGREKETIKTSFFEQDKTTPHKQSAYGVWEEGLAGTYHGRKSRNWKQDCLTLSDIIEVLNAGFAFAPGLFAPPANESYRSGDYCEEREIILLDGDEWTDECPAPADLDALLSRYPDIVKDFYWVGESISSRSSLKPELRVRLMLVLPKPIYKGETDLWETAVDWAVGKYPFIAHGVGIDKVRLSFGNARSECENRVLGGLVSLDTFSDWVRIASEKQAKAEQLRLETERQKKETQARRDKDTAVRVELQKRGHSLAENVEAIREFCDTTDPATLLNELGATQLSGQNWHWQESSPGRSFELVGEVLKIYSNSMQSASPESDGTKPVNAHRFILYYLHTLDITKRGDQHALRCILANQGYGTHPDVWEKEKDREKATAVREGLISPLEFKSKAPAKPLPVEKERKERILHTLEQNAPVIREAFEQDVRVVGLRAGTGEGKTEQAVSFAVSGGSVAMSLNTTPLAEQVYERFERAETHAFLWRSRWWGYGGSEDRKRINLIPLRQRIRDFQSGDVLCIKPHLCKASQDRGVPAPVSVCSSCEVQASCRSDGYLSQTPLAQKSQVLCIAQPKLFLDPLHRGFFRELSKGQPSERVCVVDEAKAHDMFVECSLSKAVLQQWVRDWEGEKLGDFAETVLDMLEVKTLSPYQVAELVNGYSDKDIQALSKQCSRYRVSYEKIGRGATDKDTGRVLARHSVRFAGGIEAYVAVNYEAYEALQDKGLPALQPIEVSEKGFMILTPSQAFALGVYNPEDMEGINALPRLYEQSNWTPFQQLKAFIERYQRECDAPIWYVDGVLHWVIPPVVHSRVKKLVCMSATLQKEGFERAFDSVPTTFISTPPTPWVDGAKAFQVRTGKYPRRTLLDSVKNEKGKYEYVSVSDSGAKYLRLIEQEIERDRSVKHVLITMKGIVELVGKELTKKHKNLTVMSFHKMEGLDFTEKGIVFWVFGCPEITKDIVARRAKVLYGNDNVALNYERGDSYEYVDKRVQLCWLSEVIARMQQAVGRARLNRIKNTVIVFSNVLIPDFTGRSIGFVPEDLEVAAGLSNLTEVANQRLLAEQNATPQDTKTARQRKQETRDLKDEQKAEVYRLYNANMSKTNIAKETGVSRPTIDKWLKKLSF